MFKNPFSFEGRIRRSEYALSYIIYLVAAFVLEVVVAPGGGSQILLFAFIPLLWFLFAQGTKRCHDRGASGWYQLIPFYVFWLLFADSDHGLNEYGPNPKGFGNIDEIDEIGSHLSS